MKLEICMIMSAEMQILALAWNEGLESEVSRLACSLQDSSKRVSFCILYFRSVYEIICPTCVSGHSIQIVSIWLTLVIIIEIYFCKPFLLSCRQVQNCTRVQTLHGWLVFVLCCKLCLLDPPMMDPGFVSADLDLDLLQHITTIKVPRNIQFFL